MWMLILIKPAIRNTFKKHLVEQFAFTYECHTCKKAGRKERKKEMTINKSPFY